MADLNTKKVAIIGAGASGISAAIELSKRTSFELTIFESRKESGGTWNLDKDVEGCKVKWDADGRTIVIDEEVTPMYESLRTNIPLDLMSYRDSTASVEESHLFVTPSEVLSYLQSQCAPFNRLIRFSTTVTSIFHTPSSDSSHRKWTVLSRTNGEEEKKETFDFVIVANGHYRTPYIPYLPNLSKFKGEITHAKWYRSASQYADKKVLVVGNSSSGYDIARELVETAVTPIHQSIQSEFYIGIDPRDPEAPEWAKKISIVSGFVGCDTTEDGEVDLLFSDGEKLKGIQVIVFATGYLYDFPFLHPTQEPWKTHPIIKVPPVPSTTTRQDGGDGSVTYRGGLRVHGLDKKQLFWMPDPTLAFLCLHTLVVPFPLAETQAKYLAHVWTTYSSTDNYPIEAHPEDKQAEESRKFHRLGFPPEFEYADEILDELKEDRIEEWRKERRAQSKVLRLKELGY